MRPHDNRAWFLILPALSLLGLVGALPLLAVINYGFHDIFTLQDVYWVGPQWFTDILQSDRFLASLGGAFSSPPWRLAARCRWGSGWHFCC